jgi:hypothetical protein
MISQSREPASGCRARHDGKVLAGTEDDRFISVMTELAVMFLAVNSTKIEKVSSAVACQKQRKEI